MKHFDHWDKCFIRYKRWEDDSWKNLSQLLLTSHLLLYPNENKWLLLLFLHGLEYTLITFLIQCLILPLESFAIFYFFIYFCALQISGFIDLAQRIKKENFLPYLTGQKRLKPRQGDLSFANLTKRKSRLCSSENWKVLSEDDSQPAINFEHKITGRKVSSLWVIGDQNIDDGINSNKCDSWKEIKTDSKRIKIMCFDECLT